MAKDFKMQRWIGIFLTMSSKDPCNKDNSNFRKQTRKKWWFLWVPPTHQMKGRGSEFWLLG